MVTVGKKESSFILLRVVVRAKTVTGVEKEFVI